MGYLQIFCAKCCIKVIPIALRHFAVVFLEPNVPHAPPPPSWLLKAHHIVFLHLRGGTYPLPNNLNKCCALASPGFNYSSKSA